MSLNKLNQLVIAPKAGNHKQRTDGPTAALSHRIISSGHLEVCSQTVWTLEGHLCPQIQTYKDLSFKILTENATVICV